MLPTFAYIGTNELLIVGAIVLVLFGGSKLPQLAKGLGEGIREFKKSVGGDSDDNTTPPPSTTIHPTPTETASSAK